jgi:putative membrane protein
MQTKHSKTVSTLIINGLILLSTSIFFFLAWYIYFKSASQSSFVFVGYLPLLNCILNTLCATSLCLGVRAILNKQEALHKRYMLSAIVFSALFLISYLTYHHFQGDTVFLAEGLIRYVYFFILISHIFLTLFVLPLILVTVFHALNSENDKHKRLAKWTFPLWLYVSVTGVLIYLFQVAFN